MTTWVELRTAALVGTERRPLQGTWPMGADTTGLSPEQQALHAAALLGAARRAGLVPERGANPSAASTPGPAEPTASAQAIQLLELLLGGNLGRAQVVSPLVQVWFVQAERSRVVLPHHLLLAVLERATNDAQLRAVVRPALGARGRWLGGRREEWAWASSPAHETAPTPESLIALASADRVATLRAVRERDPELGRSLLGAAWSEIDATARASLLDCMKTELGPADETQLEAALDDRSKQVRAVATRLLDGLPGSQRAARCAALLEPLIDQRGRFRRSLDVTYPAAPDSAAKRDLPPVTDATLVVEAAWFRALVAGAPLAWWEARFDLPPHKILGHSSNAAADLVAGWTRAAVAERNVGWAIALLDNSALLDNGVSPVDHLALIRAFGRPWPPELAMVVLRWIRDQKTAAALLGTLGPELVECLPPAAVPQLERWLDGVKKDDNGGLHLALRNVIQLLSTRNSILEAFR